MALHLHPVTLSNTEEWDYAYKSLKHHGNKLAEIWKLAPASHLLCIIKIYIYLREAWKVDFYFPKLQEKWNKAMLAKIITLEGGGVTTPGVGKSSCKKCRGEAHSGGVKKCPFRSLSDAEAKKQMGQLMGTLSKMSPDDVLKALRPDAIKE
jgi:hypothetical protein